MMISNVLQGESRSMNAPMRHDRAGPNCSYRWPRPADCGSPCCSSPHSPPRSPPLSPASNHHCPVPTKTANNNICPSCTPPLSRVNRSSSDGLGNFYARQSPTPAIRRGRTTSIRSVEIVRGARKESNPHEPASIQKLLRPLSAVELIRSLSNRSLKSNLPPAHPQTPTVQETRQPVNAATSRALTSRHLLTDTHASALSLAHSQSVPRKRLAKSVDKRRPRSPPVSAISKQLPSKCLDKVTVYEANKRIVSYPRLIDPLPSSPPRDDSRPMSAIGLNTIRAEANTKHLPLTPPHETILSSPHPLLHLKKSTPPTPKKKPVRSSPMQKANISPPILKPSPSPPNQKPSLSPPQLKLFPSPSTYKPFPSPPHNKPPSSLPHNKPFPSPTHLKPLPSPRTNKPFPTPPNLKRSLSPSHLLSDSSPPRHKPWPSNLRQKSAPSSPHQQPLHRPFHQTSFSSLHQQHRVPLNAPSSEADPRLENNFARSSPHRIIFAQNRTRAESHRQTNWWLSFRHFLKITALLIAIILLVLLRISLFIGRQARVVWAVIAKIIASIQVQPIKQRWRDNLRSMLVLGLGFDRRQLTPNMFAPYLKPPMTCGALRETVVQDLMTVGGQLQAKADVTTLVEEDTLTVTDGRTYRCTTNMVATRVITKSNQPD